jgi:hypothetical protein
MATACNHCGVAARTSSPLRLHCRACGGCAERWHDWHDCCDGEGDLCGCPGGPAATCRGREPYVCVGCGAELVEETGAWGTHLTRCACGNPYGVLRGESPDAQGRGRATYPAKGVPRG